METPMVKLESPSFGRNKTFRVGDLVIIRDYAGREYGGRLERHERGDVWVRIHSLNAADCEPYGPGALIVRDEQHIVG